MLTVEQRGALRSTLRLAASQLGMPRVREVARGCSLLGRDSRKASPEQLKRLLHDSDHLTRLIAEAMADATRQKSALKMLHRLALELVSLPGVDQRVRQAFAKAHTALQQGDWQRASRYTEELHLLKSQSEEEVLRYPDVILALLAQDPQRIAAALESVPAASSASVRRESRLGLQLGSMIPPLMEPSHTDPEPLRSPLQELQPRRPDAPPQTLNAEPISVSPAPVAGRPELAGEPTTTLQTEPASAAVERWRVALSHKVQTFADAISALAHPLASDAGLAGEAQDLSQHAARAAELFAQSWTASPVMEHLETLVTSTTKLRDEVSQRVSAYAQELAARRQQLMEQLAYPPSEDGIQPTPRELHDYLIALRVKGEEHLRQVSELAKQPWFDEVWRNSALASAPPDDGLLSLIKGVEEVRWNLASLLQQRAAAAALEAAQPTLEGTDGQESHLELPIPPSAYLTALEADESAGRRVAFQTAVPFSTFPSTPIFAQSFKELPVEAEPADGSFLPFSLERNRKGYRVVAPAGASPALRAGAAARSLIAYWAAIAHRGDLLGFCLEPLKDARLLADAVRGDEAASVFEDVVVALALFSCYADRALARGRRKLGQLLEASDAAAFDEGSVNIALAAASSPALARAHGDLLAAGFGPRLVRLLRRLQSNNPAAARNFAEALATAAAGLGGVALQHMQRCVYETFDVNRKTQEDLVDYLEDNERNPRRGGRPPLPTVKADPMVIDLFQLLGDRLWERGRDGGSKPRINISIPRGLERDGGLSVEPQARHIELPLLVRNSGDAAAAGVSVVLQKPVRGSSPILPIPVEAHIPWLSDVKLEATSAAVVPCRIEIDPERLPGISKLAFHVQAAWLGGRSSDHLEIPISIGSPRVFESKTLIGADGKPMDLNDPKTFELSSMSVQRCYRKLHDQLRSGQSVRAIIYGRRRRGKSSIIRSLERDPQIHERFLVHEMIWNGPRMTRLTSAIQQLSDCLRSVLLRSGADVAQLDVSDLSSADEITSRYFYWLNTTSKKITQPLRVLLLLDEFQKWLAGLSSDQERLALLTALRHFNENALGKLDVSFVLCGLQNLRQMMKISADFANAVDPFEVRELTAEEADKYLRFRLEEELSIELDDRTRKRLIRLSGGNPYVLNRLGFGLLDRLRDMNRRWCTVKDIDDLIEDPDESRLDHYLQYMLREDEDENAATLRQLTVLRAVASLLRHRGDFTGYVRVLEVENWLSEQSVPFDKGQPAQQLLELAHLGILSSSDNERFFLHGEWICRQLAALPHERAPLQPVTRRAHQELVLNRYRKTTLLDGGAQAEIWQAENVEEGGNDVVLKIYKGGTIGVDRLVDAERSLLRRIQHRNVVKCLGGSTDPKHGGVVVLEKINGQPLSSLLQDRPPAAAPILPGPQRSLAQQIEFFGKLADAVRACHTVGVAHKDLSARNIMMVQQGGIWEPIIVDFGLAGCDSTEIDEGTVALGTPGYLAPEKVRGRRRTRASDIYSLGVLFWQLSTGRDPVRDNFLPAAVPAQLSEGQLPPRLIHLIKQMLVDVPADRPSADDVGAALKTVLMPETPWDFHDKATHAFLEDRLADASALIEKALAAVQFPERCGSRYHKLLVDAVEICIESREGSDTCTGVLISRWAEFSSRADADALPWDRLIIALSEWSGSSSDREAHPLSTLLRCLLGRQPSQGLAQAVTGIARQARGGVLAERREAVFELLSSYGVAKLVASGQIETFCISAAESARVQRQDYLNAELWLRRCRALGLTLSEGYQKEDKLLTDVRQRTRRQQTLPPSCVKQDGLKLGEAERGHVNYDKIKTFAERVCRLYPFVARLRRVEKDEKLRVTRPTLLRLNQLASHIPRGSRDPGNIIPLVLDSSFTGDVPIRMNIELEPSTTQAQREAAMEQLRANTDLFVTIDDVS